MSFREASQGAWGVMYEQPSKRFRLAVGFVFVILGAAASVYGALNGQWVLTVLGGGGACGFVVMIIILLVGKDPWWMRPWGPLRPPDSTNTRDARRPRS